MTTIEALPALSPYDTGRTPSKACQYDQRFSYCLYVPKHADPARTRILVAIHGTERGNQALRDLFVPLADALDLIVLAPLFPCGIDDPTDRDNYKYVEYHGTRFDLVTLAMVEEVASLYGLADDRFLMFGFSGGAHLAHRFFYLHPQRLAALSVCAPGSPTLLDADRPWWVGVQDMEARFGRPLDLPAMRAVPVHLAVGLEDKNVWEITHKPGGAHWMEGANDTGITRIDRLRALEASLRAADIVVRTDLLPGVQHELKALAATAIAFFGDVYGATDAAA